MFLTNTNISTRELRTKKQSKKTYMTNIGTGEILTYTQRNNRENMYDKFKHWRDFHLYTKK